MVSIDYWPTSASMSHGGLIPWTGLMRASQCQLIDSALGILQYIKHHFLSNHI